MRRGCFQQPLSGKDRGSETLLSAAGRQTAEAVPCESVSRSTPVRTSGRIGQTADQLLARSARRPVRHFTWPAHSPTRRSTLCTGLIKTCLILVGLALSWVSTQAEAAGYKFQIIAQPGDVIDGQTITGFSIDDNPVAINNDRKVVFMAELGSARQLAIMTTDHVIAGAEKVVDGVVPYFSDEEHRVSINDSGQVAYAAYYQDAVAPGCCDEVGVFRDDRLLVGTDRKNVVEGKRVQDLRLAPVINNQGTVAFVALFEGVPGASLLTQDGIVAGPGHPLADGTPITALFGPQINDAGTIAFTSGLPGKNNSAIFTQDGLLVESAENVPGDGFKFNTVIDGRAIAGDISSFGINDSGEVAFWAVTFSPTGGSFTDGLFTQSRRLVEGDDVVDGEKIGNFRSGRQFSNSGMYSFLADVTGGEGLFLSDKLVVETGDMIVGHTITDFNPLVGMNDRGDLIFLAHFQGGGAGIVLATIPEPSTLLLGMLGIGVLLVWTRAWPCQPSARIAVF